MEDCHADHMWVTKKDTMERNVALQGDARRRARLSRYHLSTGSRSKRVFPLHALHLLGRFLRLLSVYVVYQYLTASDSSVVIFTFLSVLAAAVLFLIVHHPWRGRPLTTHQIVPTIINGALLALSYVMWGHGLRACGPLRTIMAEYVGAVLGAISTLFLGSGGGKWKKVVGLVAMVASYFFLFQGWAMSSFSPFSYRDDKTKGESFQEKGHIGFQSMSLAIFAGVLAGLCRVVARRVSLKTQIKRRLHVLTVTAAACFLFPIAVFEATQRKATAKLEKHTSPVWTLAIYTLFGLIVPFYVDLMAEERLQISIGSSRHLLITSSCISILETVYSLDFSFLGFLICTSLLGLGIYESMPLERHQKDTAELPTRVDDLYASQDSLIMSPIMDPQ